jgi:general secretion pathway protein N
MTYYRTIAILVAALPACGAFGASALAATPLAALEAPETAFNPGTLDPAEPARPAVPTAHAERAPAGNPLWGIPLRLLTATRERPLFSPSRRPPSPPVVAAPQLPPRAAPVAKPAEPDHPLLTIVGTIVGETDAIGVFIDQATNDVIRLHTGQDHAGWILRSVQGRETTFEKDRRTATLALPAPGALPGAPADSPPGAAQPVQAAMPVPAVVQGNTWTDGDGQLITPPKTFQASGAVGRAR